MAAMEQQINDLVKLWAVSRRSVIRLVQKYMADVPGLAIA
jgi:hypothetical protein